MSEQSPNLSLPLIQAAQAQKHVTHNEAIELLDMIVHLSVQDFGATTPPSLAIEGQAWALDAAPTGVWAGMGGTIASWRGGGWLFVTPQVGWQAWGVTQAALRIYTNNGWESVGAEAQLQNTSGIGINTSSDATNKLAVAADATLLTHDGAGHQLKLNKAGASDTASLLYQSNWSGRAEIGLAGTDDFTIKTSPDGTTFNDAIVVSKDDGSVSFPNGTTGSGSAAGALGLQVVAFASERNGGFFPSNTLSFGNGGTGMAGPVMPFAGRVIAASLSIVPGGTGANSVNMMLNKVSALPHSVDLNSSVTATSDNGYADFTANALVFNAGDALCMEVRTSGSTNNKAVGTFFVIFD